MNETQFSLHRGSRKNYFCFWPSCFLLLSFIFSPLFLPTLFANPKPFSFPLNPKPFSFPLLPPCFLVFPFFSFSLIFKNLLLLSFSLFLYCPSSYLPPFSTHHFLLLLFWKTKSFSCFPLQRCWWQAQAFHCHHLFIILYNFFLEL